MIIIKGKPDIAGVVPGGGFFLWWKNDDPCELYGREPIIAFVITMDTAKKIKPGDDVAVFFGPYPIIPSGETPDDYALERPDGKIDFPEDRTFDNIEDAQKYMRAQGPE